MQVVQVQAKGRKAQPGSLSEVHSKMRRRACAGEVARLELNPGQQSPGSQFNAGPVRAHDELNSSRAYLLRRVDEPGALVYRAECRQRVGLQPGRARGRCSRVGLLCPDLRGLGI